MRMSHRVIIALGVVVGIIAMAYFLLPLFGGTTAITPAGEAVTDPGEIESRALAFVQPPYPDDYGTMRIAGYVDNLGDRHFVKALVSIELRDASGNRTAVLEHEVTDVAPGQRRWFDIGAGTFADPQTPSVSVSALELR